VEFSPEELNLPEQLTTLLLSLDTMGTDLSLNKVKKKYFAKLEQRGLVEGDYKNCVLTKFGNNIKTALLGK
jgi:hypothetical protein